MRRLGKSFSDSDIQRIAQSLLTFVGVSNLNKVDVLACLRAGPILTVKGVRRLVYEPCSDEEMGADDARTEYFGDRVTIKAKYSVHQAAEAGDGRARFTLAHELGHAVMHDEITRARPTATRGSQRRRWEKPYEDPERHANVFAASLLINDDAARTLESPAEIVDRFGVSLEAATIRFEEIEHERKRPESAQRVMQRAAAFRAQPSYDPVLSVRFLPDPCENCGERALLPEGDKVRCQNCKAAMDFQDGDVAGTLANLS